MTKLRRYQNRYRGLTTRASWWDYGGDGIYHVEINLKDKARWFGEIENGVVKLSEAGKIAQQEWLRIPIKYPYVSLDEFVIMPDHMHGIVVVKMESGKNPTGSSAGFEKPENPINLESPDSPDSPDSRDRRNSSAKEAKDRKKGGATGTKNPMLYDNLGRCIRWYKALCTIQIRKALPVFQWHPKFWDNIILSEKELETVRQYIRDNPKKWKHKK
ncbi:hypothetical protein G3O08_04125 [Cryomorpha ignava]|uniref:Transposase IS200-like domain-containing protein n=1 Tax=Cryomorpha ignava TaxID=101383 RepID=A0A7K3WM17_9FLAO|nr:transposase [Cryomorpha ignava]NEN22693.1 hypothetical protein [Cryomorpha ignava]